MIIAGLKSFQPVLQESLGKGQGEAAAPIEEALVSSFRYYTHVMAFEASQT